MEALTHRRDALQNARDWVRSHKCATPARARHVEWSARSSMPMAILDVPGAGIDVYSCSSLTPPPESLPVDTLLSGDLTTVKQGFAYRIREDWLCRYVYPVQRWDPKQSVADATVFSCRHRCPHAQGWRAGTHPCANTCQTAQVHLLFGGYNTCTDSRTCLLHV